jgi:hypothetical protein
MSPVTFPSFTFPIQSNFFSLAIKSKINYNVKTVKGMQIFTKIKSIDTQDGSMIVLEKAVPFRSVPFRSVPFTV